jgi:hypothetical protein
MGLVHDHGMSLSAETQRGCDQWFVLVRHAESTANVAQLLDSEPSHLMSVTARGRDQAVQLGRQLILLRLIPQLLNRQAAALPRRAPGGIVTILSNPAPCPRARAGNSPSLSTTPRSAVHIESCERG